MQEMVMMVDEIIRLDVRLISDKDWYSYNIVILLQLSLINNNLIIVIILWQRNCIKVVRTSVEKACCSRQACYQLSTSCSKGRHNQRICYKILHNYVRGLLIGDLMKAKSREVSLINAWLITIPYSHFLSNFCCSHSNNDNWFLGKIRSTPPY